VIQEKKEGRTCKGHDLLARLTIREPKKCMANWGEFGLQPAIQVKSEGLEKKEPQRTVGVEGISLKPQKIYEGKRRGAWAGRLVGGSSRRQPRKERPEKKTFVGYSAHEKGSSGGKKVRRTPGKKKRTG